MIASVELQKSLYSLLNSYEYKAFEIVPPNFPMPYIGIGEEILIRSDTKCEKRTTHNITVHTWSKGNSSLQIREMNDFVTDTILNNLIIEGFSVDLTTLEGQTLLKEQEADSTIFHGVIDIEITLTRKGD